VLYTGFRRLGDASPLATSHPAGLGPLPDGLFFQGNFGIVTSACFRLRRRQPKELTLSIGLENPSRLGEFLDRLIELRRDGVLTSVAHVGNADRAQVSMQAAVRRYLSERCDLRGAKLEDLTHRAISALAGSPWTALAGLCGPSVVVRANLAEIRRRLAGLARVRAFGEAFFGRAARWADMLRWMPPVRPYAAALTAAQPLQALALGTPTDAAFDNLIQMYGPSPLGAEDYGSSRCGVLFVNPALPMSGAWSARFIEKMGALAKSEQQTLYVTLNIESADTLVAVINVLYDRSNVEASKSATRLADRLLAMVHAEGLELYRARVDQMAEVTARTAEHWDLLKRLKQAWDPADILSPGRYTL
jgi:4-cresol dehydrogenase (hydroxylating) flavoprotein subunit